MIPLRSLLVIIHSIVIVWIFGVNASQDHEVATDLPESCKTSLANSCAYNVGFFFGTLTGISIADSVHQKIVNLLLHNAGIRPIEHDRTMLVNASKNVVYEACCGHINPQTLSILIDYLKSEIETNQYCATRPYLYWLHCCMKVVLGCGVGTYLGSRMYEIANCTHFCKQYAFSLEKILDNVQNLMEHQQDMSLGAAYMQRINGALDQMLLYAQKYRDTLFASFLIATKQRMHNIIARYTFC